MNVLIGQDSVYLVSTVAQTRRMLIPFWFGMRLCSLWVAMKRRLVLEEGLWMWT